MKNGRTSTPVGRAYLTSSTSDHTQMMHKQCLAACACFPGVQADTDLQHDHDHGVVGLGALVSVGRRVLVRIWFCGHHHVVGGGVLHPERPVARVIA